MLKYWYRFYFGVLESLGYESCEECNKWVKGGTDDLPFPIIRGIIKVNGGVYVSSLLFLGRCRILHRTIIA